MVIALVSLAWRVAAARRDGGGRPIISRVPDCTMDFSLRDYHPVQQMVAVHGWVPLSSDARHNAHALCHSMLSAVAADGLGRKPHHLVV